MWKWPALGLAKTASMTKQTEKEMNQEVVAVPDDILDKVDSAISEFN